MVINDLMANAIALAIAAFTGYSIAAIFVFTRNLNRVSERISEIEASLDEIINEIREVRESIEKSLERDYPIMGFVGDDSDVEDDTIVRRRGSYDD